MKIVYQNVLWLCIFATYNYLCLAKHDVHIAALFNKEQKEIPVNWDVLQHVENQPYEDTIEYSTPKTFIVPKSDTFAAAKILCNLTETEPGISAIFGPKFYTTSATLESICSHLGIPYVSANWLPQTTTGAAYKTSFNLFPKSEIFSQGLAAVVKSLDWKQFAVLYETEEGLIRLQDVIKLQEFNKNLNNKNKMVVKKLGPGLDHRELQWKVGVTFYTVPEVYIDHNFASQSVCRGRWFKKFKAGWQHRTTSHFSGSEVLGMLLKEIRNASINRIVLDCDTNNVINILNQGKEVRLVDFSTSFFLTSLDAHTIDYQVLSSNINITTVRLFNNSDENFQRIIADFYPDLTPDTITTDTALMHDAIMLLGQSIKDAAEAVAKAAEGEEDEDEEEQQENFEINPLPLSCGDPNVYRGGLNIAEKMHKLSDAMNEMLTQHLLTGPRIQLDGEGKRSKFTLYVHEMDRYFRHVPVADWKPIGEEDKDVECPEFKYLPRDQQKECPELKLYRNATELLQRVRERIQNHKFIVTSRLGKPYLWERNNTELTGNDRYYGYSMDLISEIAKVLNFTFEFHITENNEYKNLVEDLLQRRADLAICDLTITHQRREVIDFSMPFMTLGISILHKKDTETEDADTLYAFLRPFSLVVWIYTATLYLIISIVIFFIARMAPDDWENPHPCDQNPEELENIWGIKNCLWLTLGSIMTQGCDILPKGISSRMATSMWWFFSLIMTSSYTANLAAFLTMQKMETPINSAEGLANQNRIKYGAVIGGSTQGFFRDSNNTLYQKMWNAMNTAKPSVFEKDNAKGVERVNSTKNGLYAFLMESTGVEYEIETKCNLRKVGSWLDSKSYGIGMPMNADYRSEISRAVLQLQEEGKLNELKERWWKKERDEPRCEGKDEETETSELALANVGGVFLVLGAGVAIAFLLAIVEFLWNVQSVAVEEHLPYFETLKAELKFACNVWVTKKKTKPVISESSSSKSSMGASDNKSMARSILHGASSFLNINTSVLNRLGSRTNLSNGQDS